MYSSADEKKEAPVRLNRADEASALRERAKIGEEKKDGASYINHGLLRWEVCPRAP